MLYTQRPVMEDTGDTVIPTFESQGPGGQIENEMNPISGEDEAEECFNAVESLENYCDIIETCITNNSLDRPAAEILLIGIKHQYKKAKIISSPMISLESFDHKERRELASKVILVDVREQVKYIKEKLAHITKK